MKKIIKKVSNIMIDLLVACAKLYCLPMVLGNPFKTLIPPKLINMNYAEDGCKIFYINGICCNENSIRRNSILLSNIFSHKVEPLSNPTEGFLKDVKECVFGRTFDKIQSVDVNLAEIVSKSLDENDKVIIIAHSQGSIILNSILKIIINHKNINRLEIYTFASASDEIIKGDFYGEHFANNLDYVSQIGIIHYIQKHHGRVYVKNNEIGHLLYYHYLLNFTQGKYCNKKSRLYGYYQNGFNKKASL